MKLTVAVGLTLWIVEYCMTAITHKEVAILKQMQDWGYSIFSSIKGNNTNQYLVAVVVPDDSNPANFVKYLLNGCPAKPNFRERLLECSTSAVILNKIDKEIWRRSDWHNVKRYEDHPWHGEYRLLVDGIAERLTNNFLSDNPNLRCKIYLYSFYIPCALIRGMPYSCASLIGNYNNAQKTKCEITLVGYSEVFDPTKVKASKTFLTDVYIDLIHFKREVQVTAIQNVQTKQSFQEFMFQCVNVSPLSECCVDNQRSGENSQRIVSYFVNAMMFPLRQNQKIANSNYDQAMKRIMLEEINKWLSVNIGGHCFKCSKNPKVPQYLIYFCAQRALDLSAYLGTPEDPKNLSTAKWQPLKDGKISNINMIDPKKFKNNVTLMCALRFLSIDSLCTVRSP